MEELVNAQLPNMYNVGRSRLRRRQEDERPASTAGAVRILEYVLFKARYSGAWGGCFIIPLVVGQILYTIEVHRGRKCGCSFAGDQVSVFLLASLTSEIPFPFCDSSLLLF